MADSPWPPWLAGLSLKAKGWTVHSRLRVESLKVNGLPMRQRVRFLGVSVVSSWSSRQAAVRGSLSVESMLPEMGARWWLLVSQ